MNAFETEQIDFRDPKTYRKSTFSYSIRNLRKIGIFLPPHEYHPPKGYIKYYPEDFIVEEIGINGKISDISKADLSRQLIPDNTKHQQYLHVSVVKENWPTFLAQKFLATTFSLPYQNVQRAGLKDKNAVTSQRFSIQNPRFDKDIVWDHKQAFLKDFSWENDRLLPGILKGNRFTILVRTEQKADKGYIRDKLKKINKEGFPNYYSIQRFSDRLNNFYPGLEIVNRNYEKAIKLYITKPGAVESDYLKTTRKKAKEIWGKWDEITKLFEPLYKYFTTELGFLKHLSHNPDDFIGALKSNKEVTKIFVQSFTSYLFNALLSNYILDGRKIPPELPFIDDTPDTRKQYQSILSTFHISPEADFSLSEFPFIYIKPRTYTAMVKLLDEAQYTTVPEGAILRFSLPKGSYATTFLMFFFQLFEDYPTPKWVKDKKYSAEYIKDRIDKISQH